MPKTPLKTSPLIIHSQSFWDVNVQANPDEDFGPGDISVEREIQAMPDHGRAWSVYLDIKLNAHDGKKSPPYTGSIIAQGIYEVHPDYPNDPERLVRVTGSSMLYGAVRELVSMITARGPNGMVTLPSVSFVEDAKANNSTKKAAKKAPKKTTAKKQAKKA